MEIFIDGISGLVSAEPGSDLAQIWEQLTAWLTSRSRAAVSFKLDGTEYMADEIERLAGRMVDEFSRMELTTLSPAELTYLTLSQLRPHVAKTADRLQLIGEELQKGEVRRAGEELLGSLDMLRSMLSMIVQAGGLVDPELAKMDMGGEVLSEHINQFKTHLEALSRAAQDQDLVSLADTLMYELVPRVRRWETVIDRILEKLRQERQDDGTGD